MENVTLPTSAGRMIEHGAARAGQREAAVLGFCAGQRQRVYADGFVSPEGPAVKIVQQRFGRKQQYRRQKQQAGGDRKAAFVFLLREKLHMPLKLLSLRFVLLR